MKLTPTIAGDGDGSGLRPVWCDFGWSDIGSEPEDAVLLDTGQSTNIPAGRRHRTGNPGPIPLVPIAPQSGEYLGEDDIVQFQDSHGRDGPSDHPKPAGGKTGR